jgi:hypothetical protein
MRSISGWDDYKISFVMSVCLSVCLWTLLCSQISSDFDQTRYGGEAQNLQKGIEFVCGTNWILTSGPQISPHKGPHNLRHIIFCSIFDRLFFYATHGKLICRLYTGQVKYVLLIDEDEQ